MTLSTNTKIVIRYVLYVIGIVAYLSALQFLLMQHVIGYPQLMLLIIPLIVVAYLFNIRKESATAVITWKSESVLSKREQEVAAHAAQGKVNKQIAEDLFISENTVKTHIKSILTKLEIKNRTQIAQWFYEQKHHPKG